MSGTRYDSSDNGATWTKTLSLFFTYDAKGNLLSDKWVQHEDDGMPITTTLEEYTYDDRGHQTSKQYTWDGVPQSYSETFYDDPVLKDLNTGCLEYSSYDAVNKKWTLPKKKGRLTITRNSKGDITETTSTSTANDGFDEDVSKVINTYDATTGKVVSILTASQEHDSDQPFYTTQATRLKWHNTNGQIYSADNVCFTNLNLEEDTDNQLSSATVYRLNGKTTLVSNIIKIQASYDDKGGYIRETKDYWGWFMRITKTISDKGTEHYVYESYKDINGDGVYSADEMREKTETDINYIKGARVQTYSNELRIYRNEDGTESKRQKYIRKRDEYGNITLYDNYDSYDKGQTWKQYGQRHTYEYDKTTGVMLSETIEDYNGQEQQYEKSIKYVYSQIEDVATAIEQPSAGLADAPTAVYNLQGVYMGTSTTTLPAGIYLVKQGDKTRKVIKR